jgi:phospholipid/cholesterol/gamma-HCH transport system substrate-binding protein
MKIKFNPYERVAGLFVLTAIVGSMVATVAVAVKKGWFDAKVTLSTDLKNADGVREGTYVQMAGLRAGTVKSIELKPNNEIRVLFEVSEKFKDRVREDSVVHVIRPFIIGEKVLDISVGSDATKPVQEFASLKSEATTDVMDLVSGKALAPYIQTISEMMENLRFVAEKILDPSRSKSIVKMFDDLAPTVHNLRTMSGDLNVLVHDVNNKNQLTRMVANLSTLSDELAKALPAVSRDAPELAGDLSKIARNMAILTDEISKTLPMIKEIGPEVPHATRRALEALDETVVTLKALQKSFLLRGSVKDVRDEEAEREAKKTRAPANQDSDASKGE